MSVVTYHSATAEHRFIGPVITYFSSHKRSGENIMKCTERNGENYIWRERNQAAWMRISEGIQRNRQRDYIVTFAGPRQSTGYP